MNDESNVVGTKKMYTTRTLSTGAAIQEMVLALTGHESWPSPMFTLFGSSLSVY